MADLPVLIRAERRALIDYLATLGPQEWATPSLCGGWTVQDVAAHLASAPVLTPVAATIELVRAGFRPNRFIADSAVRFARRGRGAILAQLEENAANDARPMGMPRVAALVDAVVHGLDIRRPLGDSRPVPPEAFRAMADFCAGTRWPASAVVGGDVRRRIAGLRLVADDAGWTHGSGPDVHGSGAALALVLTGRPVGPAELTGPGAATLHARL